MKTKKTTNTFKRPFDLLVMRLRWLNPWLIVKWIYSEEDENGLSTLKRQGTNYLYEVLFMGAVLWLCNLGLFLIGFKVHKSELGIYDA